MKAFWGIISRHRPYVGTKLGENEQIELGNLVKELWFEHRVAESDLARSSPTTLVVTRRAPATSPNGPSSAANITSGPPTTSPSGRSARIAENVAGLVI